MSSRPYVCILPSSLGAERKLVKIPPEALTEEEQQVFFEAVKMLYEDNKDAKVMNTTTLLMMKLKMCSKSMGAFSKYVMERTT